MTSPRGARSVITLELPYPPTVNHYWRRVGRRTLISRDGRRYREHVCALLASDAARPMSGRLEVVVHVFPPDRRRRDLDNAMKALLDALEHAGVYRDDSQIDRLVIERGDVIAGGKVIVQIEEQACDGGHSAKPMRSKRN